MRKVLVLAIVGLLTGCVTAPAPVAPVPHFSSPQLEADRFECMKRDGLWMETREHFVCREREKGDVDT